MFSLSWTWLNSARMVCSHDVTVMVTVLAELFERLNSQLTRLNATHPLVQLSPGPIQRTVLWVVAQFRVRSLARLGSAAGRGSAAATHDPESMKQVADVRAFSFAQSAHHARSRSKPLREYRCPRADCGSKIPPHSKPAARSAASKETPVRESTSEG